MKNFLRVLLALSLPFCAFAQGDGSIQVGLGPQFNDFNDEQIQLSLNGTIQFSHKELSLYCSILQPISFIGEDQVFLENDEIYQEWSRIEVTKPSVSLGFNFSPYFANTTPILGGGLTFFPSHFIRYPNFIGNDKRIDAKTAIYINLGWRIGDNIQFMWTKYVGRGRNSTPLSPTSTFGIQYYVHFLKKSHAYKMMYGILKMILHRFLNFYIGSSLAFNFKKGQNTLPLNLMLHANAKVKNEWYIGGEFLVNYAPNGINKERIDYVNQNGLDGGEPPINEWRSRGKIMSYFAKQKSIQKNLDLLYGPGLSYNFLDFDNSNSTAVGLAFVTNIRNGIFNTGLTLDVPLYNFSPSISWHMGIGFSVRKKVKTISNQ
jgi:hypothetical protein